MSSNKKLCKNLTRDMVQLQKQLLDDDIAESANAMAYIKFLGQTMKQLRTFDKRTPEFYVDYVARDVERQQKSAEKRALKREHAVLGSPQEKKAAAKEKNKKASGAAADDLATAKCIEEKPAPAKGKKRKEQPVARPEEKVALSTKKAKKSKGAADLTS